VNFMNDFNQNPNQPQGQQAQAGQQANQVPDPSLVSPTTAAPAAVPVTPTATPAPAAPVAPTTTPASAAPTPASASAPAPQTQQAQPAVGDPFGHQQQTAPQPAAPQAMDQQVIPPQQQYAPVQHQQPQQQLQQYPGQVQAPTMPPAAGTTPPKKPKKNIGLLIAAIAFVLFIVLGGVIAWNAIHGALQTADSPIANIVPGSGDEQSTEASPTAVIQIPDNVTNPSEDELSVQVARRVLPSVVSISGQLNMGMGGMVDTGGSAGAGVILSTEGYIVTNNHVVEHLSQIQVTAGAETYPAVLVGADPTTDLAVLKIDPTGDLPVIEIGTSSNLLEGQYVMAVGSPFGHDQSVSAGIISGLGRSNIVAAQGQVTAYVDLIQTDAAINPGNSGGALVDKDGRLIGINSLINTLSGASAGVGFAIPVDTVVHVVNQLIEQGHASHAFLGISTQSITPEIAAAYGFPVERGAVVNDVAGGSPADVAGLRRGDFIVRIGERTIQSSEDVLSAIRSHRVGDSVEIEIYRTGENTVLNATLASDDFLNRQDAAPQNQQGGGGNLLPEGHPPTP